MNKKQRNRKIVAQNKRNRIINRRYSSTIKTLSKLFNNKLQMIETNNEKGNIRPRRKTRINVQKQKQIARAIRKSRALGIIPFTCQVTI